MSRPRRPRRNPVAFLGSKQMGLSVLKAVCETLTDTPVHVFCPQDDDDARSCRQDFEAYCAAAGLPLEIVPSRRQLHSSLQALEPAVLLVSNYYQILPAQTRACCRLGVYGFHASLLPQLRGNAPLVWAILNGFDRTGVTLFSLEEELDAGGIVGQTAFPIAADDTIAELIAKATDAACSLAREHVASLVEGTAVLTPQIDEQASYGSKRRPEDGVIDWSRSAEEVVRFIRAQTRPYPGAFTYRQDGGRVWIWQARVFPRPYHGIAGLIQQQVEDGLVVCCGNGAIVVTDLAVETDARTLGNETPAWGDRFSLPSQAPLLYIVD